MQRTLDFDAPRQRHSPTSCAAADSIAPVITELQRRVLAFVADSGGATDEQIIDGTGLPPSTARPRRIELTKRGFIRDSGQTRPTRSGRRAVVWCAVVVDLTREG